MKSDRAISWQNFITILALTSLAFSQPVFDLISRNAEFLAVRHVTVSQILLFTFLIGVLIPCLVALITLISSKLYFGENDKVFYLLFFVLVMIIIFPWFKDVYIFSEIVKVILLLLCSIVVFIGYIRYRMAREFFKVLSISILVFPLNFLLFTPVKNIMVSNSTQFDPTTYQYGNTKKLTPVVLVVLDELSLMTLLNEDREIDAQEFKNLAEFLSSSTWYKNASTISNFTTMAVPAILTGNFPVEYKKSKDHQGVKQNIHEWLGLPIYTDYPDNIFTLLSTSHQMNVREQATRLCPYPLCITEYDKSRRGQNFTSLFVDTMYLYLNIIVPKNLKSYLPNVEMGWAGFDISSVENDRKQIFWNFVGNIKNDTTESPFIFIHSILPHMPWIYTSTGELNGHSDVPGWTPEKWISDLTVLHETYNLYYEQTKFVDKLLGQLFSKLKAANLYEDALIIITSDHGVSVLPGMNSRSIEGKSTVDVLSVPLFVHYPKQSSPMIDERYATVLDIVPTIAEVLNIENMWPTDGLSLLGHEERDGHNLKFYVNNKEIHGMEMLTIDYKSMSWIESIRRKYQYLNAQP